MHLDPITAQLVRETCADMRAMRDAVAMRCAEHSVCLIIRTGPHGATEHRSRIQAAG